MWDFPGGLVVKTPLSHAGGCGFDPWLGNEDLTCHAVWPKKKKEPIKKDAEVSLSFPKGF